MPKIFSGINILDQFFSMLEFNTINYYFDNAKFNPTYQPGKIFFPNRLKAYPVWEYTIEKNSDVYNIVSNKIKEKIGEEFKVNEIFFRKVYLEEILKSPFKNRSYGVMHDDTFDDVVATGIVYLNTFSIKDGTSFFSYKEQLEPDIIIGSKQNRCLFFDASMLHAVSIDLEERTRNILVFFLKKNDI